MKNNPAMTEARLAIAAGLPASQAPQGREARVTLLGSSTEGLKHHRYRTTTSRPMPPAECETLPLLSF